MKKKRSIDTIHKVLLLGCEQESKKGLMYSLIRQASAMTASQANYVIFLG